MINLSTYYLHIHTYIQSTSKYKIFYPEQYLLHLLIYIYMCVCVQTHTQIYIYIYIYMCVCVCANTLIFTRLAFFLNKFKKIAKNVSMHPFLRNKYIRKKLFIFGKDIHMHMWLQHRKMKSFYAKIQISLLFLFK